LPAKTGSTAPTTKPEPIIRATMEEAGDERPLAQRSSLLGQAEEEFRKRRYREAGLLFEQAHQADPAGVANSRERWAYCKLFRIVDQLNHPPASGPAWEELEKEVRQAVELAPRLDYGKYLLGEVQKRRQAAEQATFRMQHFERGKDGWARMETANFRIFHNQQREVAEQVAQVAERTRVDMQKKWFAAVEADWNPRCDIYLHATAQDYSRSTGVPSQSPGHSSFRCEDSRVVGRRIDLRCDEANMMTAVLPHETTHVVLADRFGDRPVPRWADEGIAVLAEPRERVERHLRNLPRLRQENQLFQVGQLMQLADYPKAQAITAFYAQSVSLVEFLTELKGPHTFSQFLQEALKGGYESALQRYYSFRNFSELQQAWTQRTFSGPVTASGKAKTAP
jgi:hypothetical protein